MEKIEIQTHQLKNGIRIVHKVTNSPVAYCGVFIKAGSRDENEEDWGVAHFAEHMIFKGTVKRKSRQIINCLEQVGGELNAYTTKEETCVHATFLKEDYEQALELMSDVILHSTFPEQEIRKERDVIIEEIHSYKDSPSERIFDDFDEEIFGHNRLGRNILGSPKSVKAINQKMLQAFIKRNYHPENIVISSVGACDFKLLCSLAARYFGDFSPSLPKPIADNISVEYQPTFRSAKIDAYQTHCILGNLAYSRTHSSKYGLSLLCNVLGGPAMNSILNMKLREQHGYAYHTESNYTSYNDIGIFSIYFATEPANYHRCLSLVKKELSKLCEKKLGTTRLERYKKQLMGQTLISTDHNESYMFGMGKQLLFHNHIKSLEELYQKIEAITASSLLDIANEVLTPEKLSELVYK